jgi:transketolase
MIEFSEIKSKKWSQVGMRATFGLICSEIREGGKDIYIFTSDVSTSAGLDRFRKNFSNNYFDVGIAEQNLIGAAAGFAYEGFDVITTTFAPFQTIRCAEQIKVNLGYMKNKITMVGLASGLSLGNLGFTHCCIEDIGVLRSIPNIVIISPSDCVELAKALIESINHKFSVYIRLTGNSPATIINKYDYKFQIGKAVILKKSEVKKIKVAIFCNGSIAKEVIVAGKILDEKKISNDIINMHTIKPIDKELIEHYCKNSDLIVSVEEHNIIGGLGSAISEVKSGILESPKQIYFGVNDYYSSSGNYENLLSKNNLLATQIAKIIEEKI